LTTNNCTRCFFLILWLLNIIIVQHVVIYRFFYCLLQFSWKVYFQKRQEKLSFYIQLKTYSIFVFEIKESDLLPLQTFDSVCSCVIEKKNNIRPTLRKQKKGDLVVFVYIRAIDWKNLLLDITISIERKFSMITEMLSKSQWTLKPKLDKREKANTLQTSAT